MADKKGITDLNETLRVLASPYRRCILYVMINREIRTIDELIPALREVITHEIADKTRVAIQLQQIHLPKLLDAGFIDYDRRNGDIALQKASDELQDLLEALQPWEDPAIRTMIS